MNDILPVMDYNLADALFEIETELLQRIIKNLAEAPDAAQGSVSRWQIVQLRRLETYRLQNARIYEKRFEKMNADIIRALRIAYDNGASAEEKRILRAIKKGHPAHRGKTNYVKLNERKLDALINATINDLKKAEHAVLRQADDIYRKTIFKSAVYLNSGTASYTQAVDMAVRDYAVKGIQCITYKNGAIHTISDYADMALRTANKRAYISGEGAKRQEWGEHLVIMNKRNGDPCPKCIPWIGEILIDDVYSGGTRADGPYTLLSTAIATGLYHPRCRDVHTTYFPGITTMPEHMTEKQIKHAENSRLAQERKVYRERMHKRYDRASKLMLDPDNKKHYAALAKKWEE